MLKLTHPRARVLAGAKRRRRGGFFPTQVSAVSAWLRVAQGTSDVNGYSSIPDVLNSNPATQSVNLRKPAVTTSANGLPLMDFASTDLVWPLVSSNNQLVTCGIHTHIIPDSVTGQREIVAIWDNTGGANGKKFTFETNGATVRVLACLGATTDIRSATTGNVLVIGTPAAVGFEFNGGGALEADKCVITIDGVAQVLTFAQFAGTAAAMPTSLPSRTGNALIGALTDQVGPTVTFDGRIGPNLFAYGSAMAGVTSGLLTSAARLSLSAFERPT